MVNQDGPGPHPPVLLQLKDADTGDILAQTSESTIVYKDTLVVDREYQLVVNSFLSAMADKNTFMISSKIYD